MRNIIRLLAAVFTLCALSVGAVDFTTTAIVTFTNTAGTTNGQTFTNQLNTASPLVYRWTNTTSPGTLRLLATNTAAKAATNFYNKIAADFTNRLLVTYSSSTAVKLQSFLNASFTASISTNWGTIVITTNNVGNNTVIQASNVNVQSLTLSNQTVKQWSDLSNFGIGSGSGSSFPLTSDASAGGFSLTNLARIEFQLGSGAGIIEQSDATNRIVGIAPFSMIIGGQKNVIDTNGSVRRAMILGGLTNFVGQRNVEDVVIIGGQRNTIASDGAGSTNRNGLIAGAYASSLSTPTGSSVSNQAAIAGYGHIIIGNESKAIGGPATITHDRNLVINTGPNRINSSTSDRTTVSATNGFDLLSTTGYLQNGVPLTSLFVQTTNSNSYEWALSYAGRANITNTQTRLATDKLVSDLVAAGIWTNFVALWPMPNNESNACSINLISTNWPISWQFGADLLFSNGVTSGLLGLTDPQGYGRTTLTSTNLSGNGSNIFFYAYMSTNLDAPFGYGGFPMGAQSGPGNTDDAYMQLGTEDDTFQFPRTYCSLNDVDGGTPIFFDAPYFLGGNFMVWRTNGSTSHFGMQGTGATTVQGAGTAVYSRAVTNAFWIMAMHNGSGTNNASPPYGVRCEAFAVGYSMTHEQGSNFFAIMNTYRSNVATANAAISITNLIVSGRITNTVLTASKLVGTDANKAFQSISAGSGIVISGTTIYATNSATSLFYTGQTNIGIAATTLLISIGHTMPNTNYSPSVSVLGSAVGLASTMTYSALTTTTFTLNLSAAVGADNLVWSVIYSP